MGHKMFCIFSSPASLFLSDSWFQLTSTSSHCLAAFILVVDELGMLGGATKLSSALITIVQNNTFSMSSGQCHIEAMLRFPLLVTCHTFYHDESESNEASPLSTITNLILKHRPSTVHQRFVSGPEVVLYMEIQWLLWMSCL